MILSYSTFSTYDADALKVLFDRNSIVLIIYSDNTAFSQFSDLEIYNEFCIIYDY